MRENCTEASPNILSLSDVKAVKQTPWNEEDAFILNSGMIIAPEKNRPVSGPVYDYNDEPINVIYIPTIIITSSIEKNPLGSPMEDSFPIENFGGDGFICSACDTLGNMQLFDFNGNQFNCFICLGNNIVPIPFTEWYGKERGHYAYY